MSPINYGGKRYAVSEILRIKAQVLSSCQKLIRENLYPSTQYDGVNIRKQTDELGFIIEPMLQAIAVEEA